MESELQSKNAIPDARARLDFMRITPDTTRVLSGFWPHVQSALPAIVDGFYRHVTGQTGLARLVGNKADQLKRTQATHWERLLSGRFDAAYLRACTLWVWSMPRSGWSRGGTSAGIILC
jgi:Protoglobin